MILEAKTMRHRKALARARGWLAAAILAAALPVDAQAYIDPGTTGMLSQILYVLFYGALGVFLYFLRYIKQYLANAKQFLARLFGGQS